MASRYYHVRVNDAVRQEFQQAVPWGFQAHVMEELMKLYIALCNTHGPTVAVALILDGHIKMEPNSAKT